MSSEVSGPVGNWLLDALSSEGYGRLAENLKAVPFSLGDVSGVKSRGDTPPRWSAIKCETFSPVSVRWQSP